MDTPILQIYLLGKTEIRVNGGKLNLTWPEKAWWLFAWLALERGKQLDKDELADALWPKSKAGDPKNNLKHCVSNLLRRGLADTAGDAARNCIVSDGEYLSLDAGMVSVDVAEFDAAISSGTLEGYKKAVDLYQGDLLTGCTIDQILTHQTRILNAVTVALTTLANSAKARGAFEDAVGYWHKIIKYNPVDAASACCELMNYYSCKNDGVNMEATYREWRALVRNILPDDAVSEITKLYSQLKQEIRTRVERAKLTIVASPVVRPSGTSNNLPQSYTKFIGRKQVIAEVKALLNDARLLTLTGAGGCGKTRLSLQIATELLESYPDGVWLVELASLSESTLLTQTVASVLEINEVKGEKLEITLIAYLKGKNLLLLLDNCEHMLEACAEFVSAVLRGCPHVRFLVTSRERLNLMAIGEHLYRVPSLILPELTEAQKPGNIERIQGSEAVCLFLDRANAMNPGFALTPSNMFAVAQVCIRLDGIPLALELAASRLCSLSVEDINDKLNDRFRLLTGGGRTALPRHQTLQKLIDWSYELLNNQEKLLFCRLAVFVGGWSLQVAEKVCAGETTHNGKGIEEWEILDLLTSLVEKSLVVANTQGEHTRYRFLETLRQYADDKLNVSGEKDMLRTRHRDYFLALSEGIKPKLWGSEQVHWLGILEEEHDNLRQALMFCLDDPDGGEAGLRLGGALQRFWQTRGHLTEGRERLAAVLAHPGAREHTRLRADALYGEGGIAWMLGDYASACSLFWESLEINRELGEKGGIAGCLQTLGNVACVQGNYDLARTQYEQSLEIYRKLADKSGIAAALTNLGNLICALGDYTRSLSLQEESLEIYRELGDSRGIAISLNNAGNTAFRQGNYDLARSWYAESLEIRQKLGDKEGSAMSLNNLGNVAESRGDYDMARSQYEQSLMIYRELGDERGIASSLQSMGNVAYMQGDFAFARAQCEECLAIRQELEDKNGIAETLEALASLDVSEDGWERGARLLGAATALRKSLGIPLPPDEQQKYEQLVKRARSSLGETAFAAAWGKGCTMTPDQAVAYAQQKADLQTDAS